MKSGVVIVTSPHQQNAAQRKYCCDDDNERGLFLSRHTKTIENHPVVASSSEKCLNVKMHIISYNLYKYYASTERCYTTSNHTLDIMMCL